ncbi:uncharacterized protein LOC143215666 [Lasioglossum baleicum]|uniref:uncharacterized protein LOC143215666 n=1 Tax=Lasioglossum baleicum TaxID=434251 RepID=UPI003FCCCAAD
MFCDNTDYSLYAAAIQLTKESHERKCCCVISLVRQCAISLYDIMDEMLHYVVRIHSNGALEVAAKIYERVVDDRRFGIFTLEGCETLSSYFFASMRDAVHQDNTEYLVLSR